MGERKAPRAVHQLEARSDLPAVAARARRRCDRV